MPDKLEGYAATKIRQLDERATYRVFGRALDFDLGDSARRWKPVFPCLCVHDSPDSPCPCPPWIWWLRSDMILAEGDAGKKDHEGNPLRYFDVLVESKIMVETVHSVGADTLKNLGGKLSPGALAGVGEVDGGQTGPSTIAKNPLGQLGLGVLAGLISRAIWEILDSWDDELTPDELALFCKKFPFLCR